MLHTSLTGTGQAVGLTISNVVLASVPANIVGGENIDKPQQVRLLQIAPGTYRIRIQREYVAPEPSPTNARAWAVGSVRPVRD